MLVYRGQLPTDIQLDENIAAWTAGLTPHQHEKITAAAWAAADFGRENQLKKEDELVSFLEEQGLSIYEPDVAAFRDHVQKMYLESEYAETWPEGVLEKINALGK